METITSEIKETFSAIDREFGELKDLFSALPDEKINAIPYQDSWTAAQLLRHITRSTEGMAKTMKTPATAAERDPGQKTEHLKNIFLDTSNKFNSPEFIVPEPGPFEKKSVLNDLDQSLASFKANAGKADLSGLVAGLPMGEITKQEIISFVLFHTQRHLRQMRRICDALKN